MARTTRAQVVADVAAALRRMPEAASVQVLPPGGAYDASTLPMNALPAFIVTGFPPTARRVDPQTWLGSMDVRVVCFFCHAPNGGEDMLSTLCAALLAVLQDEEKTPESWMETPTVALQDILSDETSVQFVYEFTVQYLYDQGAP